MRLQRKRFRIEEVFSAGMPITAPADRAGDANHAGGSLFNEVLSELRTIRHEMAKCLPADASDHTLIETYKAQIAQCEKLKTELDLIHEAINRTKSEIAALHGASFDGTEMRKVTGELGAVVGGTEEAAQSILDAAEEIDQAAAALAKSPTKAQRAQLTQDIQDRVVQIFEACNFQDLAGQRINKVLSTMKFVEHHINVMMDIWGGVDEIKAHAPESEVDLECDKRFLNGPRGKDEQGHASQDDIDALFN